ncbi:MAG: PKD domain-containing protein [Pirellulales bacterium]
MTKFIEVANETPSVVNIALGSTTIHEGETTGVTVELDDSGPKDSHQVVIDWGDGSEPKIVDLAPGVFTVPTAYHRYDDEPPVGSFYTMQIRLRDNDMPLGVFVTDSRQVTVQNSAPSITQLKLFTRSVSGGTWSEQTSLANIVEGDEVKITGNYSDPGKHDIVAGSVQWSAGVTTAAEVNRSSGTFEAQFRYTDDFPIGTAIDDETIVVTLLDGDGGTTSSSQSIRVSNSAPTVEIVPEIITNPQFIPFTARVSDLGTEPISIQWQASSGSSVIQSGSGTTFTLDRSLFGTSPILLSVTAADDDGGTATLSTGVIIGTANADTITINASSFTAAGVDTLVVLGLGGTDILDASSVPAPYRVILDGGDGQDFLYGGAGNDTFILRAGDDSANVDAVHYPTPITSLPIPHIAPNYAGNDKYYLKPNSTLTVVDLEGSNSLDYSIAAFGVEFSLAQANGSVLTAQSVAPGDHFVAAIGSFNELVGSPFADRLTGASGASTFGGDGADRLKAISGTVNARFIGGRDADLFETAGTGLSGISFEGDDGADTFTNLGELSGGIIFSGGADADLFSNLGTIFSEISFEGDDGADIFSNELGGILSSISFEGDSGSDRFVNRGTILLASVPSRVRGDDGADIFENYGSLTNVIFTGGADADLFVNELSGILGGISFEGDDGADIFTNDGHLLTGVIFTGGGDADLFTNTGIGLVDQILFEGDDGADIFTNSLGGSILGLSFEGDDGADVFVNSGDLGSILTPVIFTGGADADMFINETTGVLFSLSFEGDDGADIFVNSGSIDGNLFGGIIFTGGADGDRVSNMSGGRITGFAFKGDDGADIFTNTGGGLLTEISFEGDDGADIFTNLGELTGTIIFTGGADADLFENAAGGLARSISFEGDDGADIFTNAGDLFGGVIFNGGADDDVFANLVSGFVSRLAYHGDDGADIFTNLGTLSGDLLGGISFEGDDGADIFINEGTITGILGTVIFTGGADADLFVNNDLGIINAISFEGDDGADTFTNTGNILTELVFTGGADSDRLLNFDSHMERIRFVGYVGTSSAPTTLDDGADMFANYGDFITSISFEGDDGADIFHNTGDWIGSIDFNGDDGADIFLSAGSDLVTISFEGDDGADVFGVTGTNLGSISFEGDANDVGNDTFVNRSTPSTTGPATLRFVGFGGLDGLRNDGAGWNITFLGGSDEDAFQNNASTGFGLFFKGDDGADVVENNGELISGISFEGDQGPDVFANGGDWVSGVTFDGGLGNDAFVNSGLNGSRFTFRGDDGADVFSNIGSFLSEISFEGDQGNDRVSNFGIELSHFQFVGGAGSDSFFNREPATSSHYIEFQSGIDDDGSDLFVNWASQLSDVTFDGGANSDELRNFGADAVHISFSGGSDNDVALNGGYRLQQFTFDGGDGDDALEQSGNEADNVLFNGGNGQDTLVIRGDYDAQLTFHGGADTDFMTNNGSHAASLTFQGDDGDDRLQNNGDWIGSMVFVGGTGADALQNNGDHVTSISVDGESGSDSVFNNGNDIGSILFTGSSGADSLIQSGSRVTSVSFWGEDDADVFRADKVIGTAFFSAGEGDDAMLWNGTDASLGTGSPIQVQMQGGSDNDVLIFRGLATQLSFQGESGNDRVVVSGSSSGADLNGGEGDDRYEFFTSPAGSFTITEGYTAPLDTSRDVLDFSAFNGPVSLDLQLVTPQQQVGGLSLALSDANGIETVIGSSGADTILGNDRDNYLAGARFFYPSNAQSNPTAPTTLRPTQWVLLDFDSYTEPVVGEHVYTAAERAAILARLRSSFAALNTAGLRVEFTMNSAELPQGIDFVTIRFNDTPLSGRPGGEASEIDFGNACYGGFARIQVSGLLGGIEVPINGVESFAETLPEDGDVTIGQDKPAATSENIIALSAKMTAHELAHLLGVRHYDSFGPVGFGIHAPPGMQEFNPIFSGPAAAFESFNHLISSPASIGTTRTNDVGQLFFGERESIKLAFATTADPMLLTGGWTAEASGLNNAPEMAQPLSLATLAVPNSIAHGLNADKEFYVDVAAVAGTIALTSEHSENDYYTFFGRSGESVTIEVMSMSLDRYTSGDVDGYIDSTVRLYRIDEQGQRILVPYFDTTAVNDDEFESTDSLLMDVKLPSDAMYIIEVDTFTRTARSTDPQGTDLANLSVEARAALDDVLNDQDTGRYELFVYRFADASAKDRTDYLEGRLGQDIIDGGPGDLGEVQFVNLPDAIVLSEGSTLEQWIEFSESRGESWTIAVDFGDGSNPIGPTSALPHTPTSVTHNYATDGNYSLTVTVINNYGLFGTHVINVVVANEPPTWTGIQSDSAAIFEGQAVTLSGSFLDPGTSDAHTVAIMWGDSNTPTLIELPPGMGHFTASHLYVDDNDTDTYSILVRVIDEDGSFDDDQTRITVSNVAPTAVISSPVTINEGSSATVSLTSLVDPSSVDVDSLRYSFALSSASLAADYSAAGNSTSSTFNFVDNGTYTVFARVIDKDGGFADFQTTITVNNVAPTATFAATPNVTIGNVTVLSFASPVEPSSTDIAAGLRYSFAFSPAGLATTYSAASTTANGTLQMLTAGVITVWGRIFDKDGGSSDYSAQVVVSGSTNNLPPTVSIQTGDSGIKGITSTFFLTATDQDAGDAAGPFTYQIQWGDGTNSTIVGGKTISVSKTYSAVSVTGSFAVSATAADARGAISQPASAAFSVLGWSILPDRLDPSDTVLVIVGSPHDDDIKVKEEDEHCDTLKVSIRDKEEHVRVRGFVTGDIDTILVFGLAGDDKISIEDDLELTVYVWGGAGDDRIKGGAGNDVLLGEQGDDTLFGGKGRDLLIGGSGSDRIHGEDNDDILIAGYTIYDLNRQALDAIMAEWTSPRDYFSRRLNLMGVSNATYGSRRNGNTFLKFSASSAAAAANDTVFDDGVQDSLWGDDARDWFLANLDGDHSSAKDLVKDRSSNESSDDIDRWF